MAQTKASRLRELIESPELLVMPGVFDVVSGRLAEDAGFAAAQVSGANLAVCHLGVPDYSIASMSEMVEHTGRIARRLDIPVMGDADTGFGNAVNAYLTVRAFEQAGVAGVNIEDQVMPKRCGHLDGKVLAPFDEAVARIAAACDARTDPDFVINARTDALGVGVGVGGTEGGTEGGTGGGLDEVIRRGNAFLDVGATMVFVEGVNSVEVIRAAVDGIRGPVGINLVEGGKSPQDMTFAVLQELGVARVSLPSTLMQASIQAMRTVLERVRDDGGIGGYDDLLCGFGVSQRLVGSAEIRALEERYLSGLRTSSEH